MSKLAEERRKNPPAVISYSVAPVIPDQGLSKKADAADWSIAKQCVHLVSRGVRPAIMLESRAGDKADLKSRAIEELIETAVRSLVTSTPPQIQSRGGSCDTRTHATINSEENYDPSEHVNNRPKERTWIDVTS